VTIYNGAAYLAPADTVILTKILAHFFSRGVASAAQHQELTEWLQQGYRSQQAGEVAAADRCYRRVLERDPGNADAHYLLGALLGQHGDPAAAVGYLQQAIAAKADFSDAHAALGNVYLVLENHAAAVASYERAVALDARNAAAYFNLGVVYQSGGRPAAALEAYTHAYALAPNLPKLLKNRTALQIELGQYDDARRMLEAVLSERPDDLEALKCLGSVLQNLHCPDQALAYYEKAHGLDPDDRELLKNLGIVLRELGRLDAAIAKFDAAIARKPDFVLARWHRSLAYLLRHDFARGWPDYELRLVSADLPQRTTHYPRWDGGALGGRSLLVYAEQGLGDEIMFASCLPQVIAASRHCTIECSPRLETLFRRSFPQASVYALTAAGEPPPAGRETGIDVQVAMGSLPQYLRRSWSDFPRHRGYLQADPQRVQVWRERLAALGPGLKIGISWQGGTHQSRQPLRSIPLARWAPLLQSAGVQCVSLQYTECSAEIAAVEAATGVRIADWREARDDLEQTAALINALDLVISVCTAAIHLGGALGRPVWVLAPYSPEWRYGIVGDEMPWYPSVRVYRQPRFGAWEPVIANVTQALRGLAAEARL